MSLPSGVIKTFRLSTKVAKVGCKAATEADRRRIEKHIAKHAPHGPARSDETKKKIQQNKPFTKAELPSVDVTDTGVTYTMPVQIGKGTYSLLIDTGSSNTFCGAQKGNGYEKSDDAVDTGNTVEVQYGSGSFKGEEWLDKVILGGELTIMKQGIAATTPENAKDFEGVDGILGIGPADLTTGTQKDKSGKAIDAEIPTVVDNLYAEKGDGSTHIDSAVLGISYAPTDDSITAERVTALEQVSSEQGLQNGEITFGGVDTTKLLEGEKVEYVQITKESPAGEYWGIDQSITYGSGDTKTTILSKNAGIVDTGTTLLYLASDAFSAYKKATGATEDAATGLLTVTPEQYESMESLFFTIGSQEFEWVKDAQIWPRALNSQLGGDESKIYLVVADSGSQSGSGLDFINGFAWLQRFYTVYDTTIAQVGVARTPFTNGNYNYGESN